jgi:cysteine desulfurase
MRKCYFDCSAANPVDIRVLDAMLPFFREKFGNPISTYDIGRQAKDAVENARLQVASLIGSKSSEIVFTSSGSEANNFAVRGIALARQNEGKHIIISSIEHSSIINSARFLEKMGFAVTSLPVDKKGIVDPDIVNKSITKETTLISIIFASSEVGTIEPIKEIAAIARKNNITFHSDAVAAAGNIPINVNELGVDLLSIAANQFYGPKGAGALYIRDGLRIVPLIFGGIQENGLRAGTENIPAIAGMGMAAELARDEMRLRTNHTKRIRDKLISSLSEIENITLTGHPEQRLPNHASFCVEFIEGEAMLLMLASKGIYADSGSACSSKSLKASPVLLAMGIPLSLAQGSIVFTLGKDNTDKDIEHLQSEFPGIVKKLREISPYEKDGDMKENSRECTTKR